MPCGSLAVALWLWLDAHLVSCSLAQDGVKQVIDSQGKYAFLLESTMNEYALRLPRGKCTVNTFTRENVPVELE